MQNTSLIRKLGCLIWFLAKLWFAQYSYSSTTAFTPSSVTVAPLLKQRIYPAHTMQRLQRRFLVRSSQIISMAPCNSNNSIQSHNFCETWNAEKSFHKPAPCRMFKRNSCSFHRRQSSLRSKVEIEVGGVSTKNIDGFIENVRISICDEILAQLSQKQPSVKFTVDSPLVILLGVSGGCDSVALFHSILSLTKSSSPQRLELPCQGRIIPCQLHVVHFDHQQRGKQSDHDRLLVEELCKEHTIDFHNFYWSDFDILHSGTAFSQESARHWRRTKSIELLTDIIGYNGGSDERQGLICTAHHKDDSEETMLLKLLRGVHITNMSGMEILQRASQESEIYFAKPMLHIRKKEISDFLRRKKLQWREDESNTSGKYLRNRVRNELMPLLNDLVGGQSVLESRLQNMEEQSRKLKNDISLRIDDQLSCSIYNDGSSTVFTLPDNAELSAIEEETLFRWVGIASNSEATLSYEKLKTICQQIAAYPDRRQWKIGIGESWDVIRNGTVLMLVNTLCSEDKSMDAGWTLSFNDIRNADTEQLSHHLSIYAPIFSNCIEPKFVLDKVRENESLKFLPSWRKGSSEIKIKEFLRGQKVPLHRREEATILCIRIDNALKVVAVFVESDAKGGSGRWVIHSNFDATCLAKDTILTRRDIVLTKSQT